MSADPLVRYAAALNDAQVRYVVIGVWGANYYTRRSLFMTEDQDLFLPEDPANLLAAWQVAEQLDLSVMSGFEPLDYPRDEDLANVVVRQHALTSVTDDERLDADLSLVMEGFGFSRVAAEARRFVVDGVELPVARLAHIVESKSRAGREKDRLFLATHADALRKLLGGDRPS